VITASVLLEPRAKLSLVETQKIQNQKNAIVHRVGGLVPQPEVEPEMATCI
jgi:hypothetical protein